MCATSCPVHVLVADSTQMQRQLLVAALRRRHEFNVRFCSMRQDDLSHAFAETNLEVALLTAESELTWEGMASVRRLHQLRPDVKKVLLVESYNREMIVNAFRSGVRG